ncbi:MAG: hypothetical protein M0Z88_02450 [Actinomycetota bacterium]|nr:hypothetical protein [Actinomycetota bacterium]
MSWLHLDLVVEVVGQLVHAAELAAGQEIGHFRAEKVRPADAPVEQRASREDGGLAIIGDRQVGDMRGRVSRCFDHGDGKGSGSEGIPIAHRSPLVGNLVGLVHEVRHA